MSSCIAVGLLFDLESETKHITQKRSIAAGGFLIKS